MKKMLLIDDEKDYCYFMKKNLEGLAGYEVTVTHSGQEGVLLAQSLLPDIILLDILMPDEDGPSVATRLKNIKSTSGIPIIFLTAIVRESEAKDSRHMIGGWHYLAKPVKIKELIGMIEDLTKKR